jgi:hypothetical protein
MEDGFKKSTESLNQAHQGSDFFFSLLSSTFSLLSSTFSLLSSTFYFAATAITSTMPPAGRRETSTTALAGKSLSKNSW